MHGSGSLRFVDDDARGLRPYALVLHLNLRYMGCSLAWNVQNGQRCALDACDVHAQRIRVASIVFILHRLSASAGIVYWVGRGQSCPCRFRSRWVSFCCEVHRGDHRCVSHEKVASRVIA